MSNHGRNPMRRATTGMGWIAMVLWMAMLVDVRSSAAQASVKPDMTLVAISREGTDRLGVGSTVMLRVVVHNRGATPATVAVGTPSSVSRQPAFRSEVKTISAGASATLRMGLVIEPRNVKNEVFTAQLHLVDPATPTTDNLLAQLWRDGNINDNSRPYSVRVLVSHYDVSITLTRIDVHEDCNPGGRSNWRGQLCAGALDPVALTWPLQVQNYEDFCDRATSINRGRFGEGDIISWPPQPNLKVTTWENVGSGESIAAHSKVSLKNVPKSRNLVINFWARVGNGPLPDQHGGIAGLERLIAPAEWTSGRQVQYSPKPRSHQYPGKPPRGPNDGAEYSYNPHRHHGRHKNCGDKPFTATFTITTAPRNSTVF